MQMYKAYQRGCGANASVDPRRSGAWRSFQRPGACVARRHLGPVFCTPDDSKNYSGEAIEGPQDGFADASISGHNKDPRQDAKQLQDNDIGIIAPQKANIIAAAALAGFATESSDNDPTDESPSFRQAPIIGAANILEATDTPGWYEYHLFDALRECHIDAQSAATFLSQLAMHDSWAHPLGMEELLRAARIADISGLSLPPIVAAQLSQLVQASGPISARATADPLLAAFDHDLPTLLDMLYAMEVRPSLAWTNYAVRSWLGTTVYSNSSGSTTSPDAMAFMVPGGSGRGAGGQVHVSVATVRSILVLLESIYLPNAEPGIEPPPLPGSTTPLASLYGATNQLAGADPGPAVVAGGTAAAGRVREWLDLCIAKLLDCGGLTLPNQREDLYGMLPHLATAPSATTVERLYIEAPPPHAAAAVGSPGAGGTRDAASPDHLAALLWLLASSGAKLPPAVVQRELRALEDALVSLASGPDSSGAASSPDAASSEPRASHGPSNGGADTGKTSSAEAQSAAVAALKAAFALPSAPGSTGNPKTTPAAPAAMPLLPVAFPPSTTPPSSTTPPGYRLHRRVLAGGGAKRLSAHGAYLCLWAFHHFRYAPHASTAAIVGPLLLATVLAGAGDLEPRQRCRVLRAVMLCFDPYGTLAQAHVRTRREWAQLFSGWETLRGEELLPFLGDLATLARLRRLRSRQGGSGPKEGTVSESLEPGVQLQVAHLAAFIVQLPGWQQRLQNVGLSQAAGSLASLMEVLGTTEGGGNEGSDRTEGKVEGEGEGAALRSGGGHGADSAAEVLPPGFAQEVLRIWLENLMPAIETGVRQATDDWGSGPRRNNSSPTVAPTGMYDKYGSFNTAANSHGAPARRTVEPTGLPENGLAAPKPSSIAGATAPDATKPFARDDPHQQALSRSVLQPQPTPLPLPVAPSVSSPSPSPVLAGATAAPLAATDVAAVLTALRNMAAALDARAHPRLHRALMWALQRLGSRAGRFVPGPAVYCRVPDMLVQLDSLGWVDVPLEWVHAVVDDADPRATWFRSLSWPEALRAVLVSGQLVQKARAEMLRRYGVRTASATDGRTPSAPSAEASRPSEAAASSPAGPSTAGLAGAQPPSKAEAFMGSATRLRSHLLGLLAVRVAESTPAELRQLAVSWQAHRLPYDGDALAVTLRPIAAVLGCEMESDGDAGTGAADRGEISGSPGRGPGERDYQPPQSGSRAVWDAVQRLVAICAAQRAPREEMERLFAPFREQLEADGVVLSFGVDGTGLRLLE